MKLAQLRDRLRSPALEARPSPTVSAGAIAPLSLLDWAFPRALGKETHDHLRRHGLTRHDRSDLRRPGDPDRVPTPRSARADVAASGGVDAPRQDCRFVAIPSLLNGLLLNSDCRSCAGRAALTSPAKQDGGGGRVPSLLLSGSGRDRAAPESPICIGTRGCRAHRDPAGLRTGRTRCEVADPVCTSCRIAWKAIAKTARAQASRPGASGARTPRSAPSSWAPTQSNILGCGSG